MRTAICSASLLAVLSLFAACSSDDDEGPSAAGGSAGDGAGGSGKGGGGGEGGRADQSGGNGGAALGGGGAGGAISAECMPEAQGDEADVADDLSNVTLALELPELAVPMAIAAGPSAFYVYASASAGDFLGETITEAEAPLLTVGVLARFSLAGELDWALRVATNTAQGLVTGVELAALSNGDVALLFTTAADVQVGDEPVIAATADEEQLVLASIDEAGTPTWVKRLVSQDGDGNSLGHLQSSPGGLALVLKSPGQYEGEAYDCGLVLARLDAAGDHESARCVSSTSGGVSLMDFAVDEAGDAYVSGFPTGPLDFGDGELTVDASGGGAFVVKIDEAGETLWHQILLRAYAHHLIPIRDSDGAVLVAGHMPQEDDSNGLIEIAGDVYLPCGTAQHATRLSSAGSPEWSRRYGSTSSTFAGTTPSGSVLFSNQSADAAPFAEGLSPLEGPLAVGAIDASDEGRVQWMQAFPSGSAAPDVNGEAWYFAAYLSDPLTTDDGEVGPGGVIFKIEP